MSTNLSPVGGAAAQFLDNNGNPLTGGKLYTYEAGTTTPQATYTTSAGNVAHANPIILDSAGRVPGGEIWLTASLDYKFSLFTSADVLIATWDNITTGVITNASNVVYDPAGSGAVQRTVESKLRDVVSVLDFGAVGDGFTNDTVAIQDAIDTGKRVYIPGGTYKCNLTINNKTVIEGDGSLETILKPYDDTVAVMTYTFTAQQNPLYRFWDYHSEVRHIGFFSNSAKTGVGFTFSKTNPADYQINDEYANNVKFYACYFEGFDKGVQFPFGNIGTEFYSCGFADNKYGAYMLNNKFGSPMHAGNKHFYSGEAHGNTCAIYINNAADGFGDVIFRDFIFEANNIGVYCYSNTTYSPVIFDNCWDEAQGLGAPGAVGSVTIDQWSGTTRSDLVIDVASNIFVGEKSEYVFNGGHFSNSRVICSNSIVHVNRARVSSTYASSVVGSNSQIIIDSPVVNDTACPSGNGIVVVGTPKLNNPSSLGGGSQAQARALRIARRSSKTASTGIFGKSVSFNSAESTSGSFSVTGSLSASSTLYANSNEFVIPFSSPYAGEFVLFNNTSQAMTFAGWYVFTFHAKWVSGSLPAFYVYDGVGTVSIAQQMTLGNDGEWQAFGGYAFNDNGATVGLWVTGAGSTTFRLSAYQIRLFDSELDAMTFISSGSFIE